MRVEPEYFLVTRKIIIPLTWGKATKKLSYFLLISVRDGMHLTFHFKA